MVGERVRFTSFFNEESLCHKLGVYPSFICCNDNDASEFVLEYDKLGGRDARRDEVEDDLFLSSGLAPSVLSDRVLTSDSGRRKETVRDRRSVILSFLTSGSAGFTGSGSLYSNFPSLSDAKYSSPRPNTTCRVAKSRVEPSLG